MSDSKPLRCVLVVRSLPLERYQLPTDGRKWRVAARNRRALLKELATYANADGTFTRDGKNYSPSVETLEKFYSRATLYRHLDHLKELGLLTWTRSDHYERREYRILMSEQVSDSGQNQVSDSEKQVSHSPETGLTFKSETQNQVSHSQKTGLIATSTIRLIRQNQEPPLPPEAVAEVCSKLIQASGHDFSESEVSKTLTVLQKRFGTEYVLPIVELFLKRPKGLDNFDSPTGILRMLARESGEWFKDAKEQIENERLVVATTEARAKRDTEARAKVEQTLAAKRLAEESELKQHWPDDPLCACRTCRVAIAV
jgi:hypothetical protein